MELTDFTLTQYRTLLHHLQKSGYTPVSVHQYLSDKKNYNSGHFVILRHDIDRRIHKSVQFAHIESQLNISASYYFRFHALQNPEIIASVSHLGHEIGYHYEVISRASGDLNQAKRLFEEDLRKFRDISPVHTVCMHGAPLSRFDNLSFWEVYQLETFNLSGEGFLSIKDVPYFSDTGRSWSSLHNLRDKLPGNTAIEFDSPIVSTKDLMNYISENHPSRLYLVTHPERWSEGRIEWFYSLGFDTLCNIGKEILKEFRG